MPMPAGEDKEVPVMGLVAARTACLCAEALLTGWTASMKASFGEISVEVLAIAVLVLPAWATKVDVASCSTTPE